jgi:VanZ family protein
VNNSITGGLDDFSRLVRRWSPVAAWMLIMLVVSTDLGSMSTSQRLLNPVFLWFNPRLTSYELYQANVVFRKICHVTEFAVLAMLVWRTRNLLKSPWPGSGTLRLAGLTLAICAFFAISTELAQYAARSRSASPWDILLNMFGSVLGLSIIFLLKKWRSKKSPALPG